LRDEPGGMPFAQFMAELAMPRPGIWASPYVVCVADQL
jgi:hypothetical protein